MTDSKLTCVNCGNALEKDIDKFCSQECRNVHMEVLAKRIKDAIANNSSHTKKFCQVYD